jgi:hypothetical protein
VIALLLLLAVLLLRALHLSVFIRYIRASSVYMPALFSTAALFGIIVFGVTDYPFANPTMFYLFWVVFGIGSATLRIAKQEREDLRIFLSAAAGAGKAELDIELDRW